MRARRSHHKVGAVLLQRVLVLLDGQAPEDHGCLDGRRVLGEALILFADQEGQLSCVAHHQHRHLVEGGREDVTTNQLLIPQCHYSTIHLPVHRLNLLQGG